MARTLLKRLSDWRYGSAGKVHSHKRPLQGMIHHSDTGSGYSSQRYMQTLVDEGLVPSIGSIGDAFDNAATETVGDIQVRGRGQGFSVA